MAEFICKNEECTNKGETIHVGLCNYRLIGGKLLADERFCLHCKQEMEEIQEFNGTQGFNVKEQFGSINKNWTNPGNKNPIY